MVYHRKEGSYTLTLELIRIKGSSTVRKLTDTLKLPTKQAAYSNLIIAVKTGFVTVDKSSEPYIYRISKSGKKYLKVHKNFIDPKIEILERKKKNLERIREEINRGKI